jgi:protein-S-isoprenylcysteine O-methyltransferase Ste14
MNPDRLLFQRAAVFLSGLIYWAGVWIQARRIRRRIGRSPNVRPKGSKERLLWVGWALVVLTWWTLPFLPGSVFTHALVQPLGSVLGGVLLVAGYAGTLWCYRAMGNAWRMGVCRTEPTQLVTGGPYRFIRHPIYLFQIFMVAGVAVLLPSAISLAALAIHGCCVLIKAADEEAYLRARLGADHAAYAARTGKWFPRFHATKTQSAGSSKHE